MDEQEEKRFGFLKEKTIDELKKIRNELLDDNEYMEIHATNSLQKSDFEKDIKFNNDQIDYIDSILKERDTKRGR